MLEKDQAICLRTVDYSDTSQIVTLFGKNSGKISAIAKGSKRARSAFEGPIEVFSFGQIVFSIPASGKLATLTEFGQRPVFRQLRSRLFALNCGLFAVELIDNLTHEHDRHPALFDAMVQFLEDVQSSDDDTQGLCFLVLFQLSLLEEIGTRPVLGRCANCKVAYNENWRQVYFSSAANGLLCPDCESSFEDKMRIGKDCAACFSDIRQIGTASRQTLNEMERVLVEDFSAMMHRRPKMAKYFL